MKSFIRTARSCISVGIITVLLTLPGMAQQARREMRGIPQEKPGEDLSEWGMGDSFEDIFETMSIRGSSSLRPNGINRYDSENVKDRNLATAWVEGAKGNGIGEYIEYTLTPQKNIGANDRAIMNILVFNGYRKTRTTWKENGRIKRMRLSVNGKPYGTILLADTYRYQTVDLGRIPLPRTGRVVLRFTIASVYPGTKYSDTAMSELEFGGTGIY